MNEEFIKMLYEQHRFASRVPHPDHVCDWLNGLLGLLFPELGDTFADERSFRHALACSRQDLYQLLQPLAPAMPATPEDIEAAFMDELEATYAVLLSDVDAILSGDPAAVSATEVIRTYPGFYAIAVYRLAHLFHTMKVPLIPRILSEYAHAKTGVDIHPGAQIGSRFCIDHGTGVVIGETVVIGQDVKIYQGVTLGALSVKKQLAHTKRHPTIEDRVVIYANATILGGDTVIGHDSIIGGNTWITSEVPPHSRIYYRQEELT